MIHVILWIIFALLIRNTWHEFGPYSNYCFI